MVGHSRGSHELEGGMRELRIHGRGGQGAVVASKLLAVALFHEDNWVQSFPAFGVERRGAPVTAFLRVDRAPIRLRCEIVEPDDIIILDRTLVEATDVAAGLKAGGTILINTERPPESYPHLQSRFRVVTVDASVVAVRHGLGSRTQPIVNTAILGAFAVATGLVGLESVCRAIREEVPHKVAANEAAAREAAAAVLLGDRAEAAREAAAAVLVTGRAEAAPEPAPAASTPEVAHV